MPPTPTPPKSTYVPHESDKTRVSACCFCTRSNSNVFSAASLFSFAACFCFRKFSPSSRFLNQDSPAAPSNFGMSPSGTPFLTITSGIDRAFDIRSTESAREQRTSTYGHLRRFWAPPMCRVCPALLSPSSPAKVVAPMGGRPLENPEGLAGSLGETQIVWLEAQGKPTMFGWKPWENPRCLAGCLVNAPDAPVAPLVSYNNPSHLPASSA